MSEIIWGNIVTFIATVLMSCSGTRDSKRTILLIQEMAMACFVLSGILLQGYSGVVQNIVGMIRNITVLYWPGNTVIGWGLVLSGIVFGILFNNRGIIGLFPVVCSVPFAVMVVLKNEDPVPLKSTMIISSLGYAVYAVVNNNLVGIITNTITAMITGISLYRDIQKKKTCLHV
ncbi:MAG: YgjV family protein [Erysipelotrichaceae bacterium]|nr:YgjV family protein [Erysipelotrichaceae bacterium]